MQGFGKFPLLRLLVPFVVGILLYIYLSDSLIVFPNIYQSIILLVLILVLLVCLLIIQIHFNIKLWISFFIDISFVLFAYLLSYYHDIKHNPYFIGKTIKENTQQYIIVKPSDVIIHKKSYNKLVVHAYRVYEASKNKWNKVYGNVLLYIPKEIKVDSIYHPNAFYLLYANLQKNKSSENPFVFNYAEYLKKQNIYYVAYIKNSHDLKFLSYKKLWNIRDWALYLRYQIINYFYQNENLDKTSKSIATAFVTGFDDELENDIIQSFSHSGILHILSVSGFHTGLLFLMINFVFSLLDPYKNRRWSRTLLTISALFFYAFMSGFSPPILRAAIMLSIVVVHHNFYTDRIVHPLNVLSAAAFFILVYNPLFLNDVGFLLSFSAVIGLIYFSPQYIFENIFLQNVWNIISMSTGAQIGTLPFVLYYFHGFPFLFILSNLIVIPLATIIMFLAIAALIPWPHLSIALNYLIQFLVYINHYISDSRTYYDWIHFTFIDACILAVLIVSFFVLINKIKEKEIHWITCLNFVLLFVSLWIILHHVLYIVSFRKEKFYFYVDKKQPIHWIQNKNYITFNQMDSLSFSLWAKKMLLENCIEKYRIYPFNYIKIHGKEILICTELKDSCLIKHIKPDVLIWNCRKGIVWKDFDYSSLEKIYWINPDIKSRKFFFNKIFVVKNGGLIEI